MNYVVKSNTYTYLFFQGVSLAPFNSVTLSTSNLSVTWLDELEKLESDKKILVTPNTVQLRNTLYPTEGGNTVSGVTQEELQEALSGLASKTELEPLAKKTDLTSLASKTELEPLAKKTDLTSLASKTELEPLAKKTDLTSLASKTDLTTVSNSIPTAVKYYDNGTIVNTAVKVFTATVTQTDGAWTLDVKAAAFTKILAITVSGLDDLGTNLSTSTKTTSTLTSISGTVTVGVDQTLPAKLYVTVVGV